MHSRDKKSLASLMSQRKRGSAVVPRVAELTAAQSEVPPSGSAPRLGARGADGCPEQLQLTHTALWSGPQSVKV